MDLHPYGQIGALGFTLVLLPESLFKPMSHAGIGKC
jgi:hypothetical protein